MEEPARPLTREMREWGNTAFKGDAPCAQPCKHDVRGDLQQTSRRRMVVSERPVRSKCMHDSE